VNLRAALARRLQGAPAPLAAPSIPYMLDALRDGPVPLAPATPGESAPLRIALVIPQFRRGSGGHKTIADLVRGLEDRGHHLLLLLVDEEGRHTEQADDTALRALFIDFFGPVRADVRRLDPARFEGADVVVATGWQTVPAVLRLPGVAARAYLVQDHEPEFYATSIERDWAEWTYRQGLHAICASPWLADLVTNTYNSPASAFDLGVDHDTYKNVSAPRSAETVLFYARPTTPRRAVPLGLLALEELHRRRPSVDIALFGEARAIAAPFPHRHLGVLPPAQLARAYATATAGVVLSLTNPSLIPTEMMACGLPVVDLAVPSMQATFGDRDALELAPPDPLALTTAIERLLDDPGLRAHRTASGLALTAQRTWPNAAAQVEAGLRTALRNS
jgi:O-antigen biosynthesis protein